MFDLGIVLAVAFLLAALQSVNLTELLTKQGRHDRAQDRIGQTVVIKQGDKLRTVNAFRAARRGRRRARRVGLPAAGRPAGLRRHASERRSTRHGDLALRRCGSGSSRRDRGACSACRSASPLGLGRFRGRGAALAIFNAGLRVPPVALGHALWLLMWPARSGVAGRWRARLDLHDERGDPRPDAARAAGDRRADRGRGAGRAGRPARRRRAAYGAGARRCRGWRCARRGSACSRR